MWGKIVLNLLSNALKFTFEGFIRVALHSVEDGIELVVQDSGVGIREEDVPHLFERFYRAQTPQARTQEGSGIGLSLVQELVRLHAGSIQLTTTEGVGTTFTVRLRAGVKHLPQAHGQRGRQLSSTALGTNPYVEEALRWLPEEEVPAEAGVGNAPLSLPASAALALGRTEDARKERVLVVDDNEDMRSYLKRLLSPSYQVLLATDGGSAFALARGVRPDLIIADVMMPGMDGFALLQALRAEPGTASMPVLLLSARAGEEATLEGLQHGANDYLVKPFSARELLGKPIREALPELEGQGFFELLDQVYATGEPFTGIEVKVDRDRRNTGALEEVYFNFVYHPIRSSRGEVEGVMVHAVEVTEQVRRASACKPSWALPATS